MTLALGTAASVAVLAVAYGALWRPLPFADPAKLVTISPGLAADRNVGRSVRLEDLERWRSGLRTASGLSGWTSGEFTVRGASGADVVRVGIVTNGFFEVLGAKPARGRLFHPTEQGVAVLAGDAATRLGRLTAVGDIVSIGSLSLHVVGSLPAAFPLPDGVDFWVPAGSVDTLQIGPTSNLRSYRMVARLAPGVSIEQARDDAARVTREIEAERRRPGELRSSVDPLTDLLRADTRPVLLAFVAAAGLLLFVACANVATSMVSRGLGRERERAIRLALGASPARIVRLALLESLIIASLAALAGIVLAISATTNLPSFVEGTLPRRALAAAGLPAMAAGVVVALLAAVISGVAPALTARRTDFAPAFRTTTTAGSIGGRRTRSALVVVQIAVAVTLLIGAGLLTRTVAHLVDTDLGIDRGTTIALRLRMTETSRFDAASRAPFLSELVRRVRDLPGVVSAGVGTNLPPSQSPVAFSIRVVQNGVAETRTFDLGSASPGYFEAVGARLRRGRFFETRDETGPPVALLTETSARHLAGLGDPIGRPLPFALSGAGGRITPLVIGVIDDIRHRGLEQPANGGIYVPWAHLPAGYTYLVVRSAASANTVGPAVLRVVRALDPALPVPEIRTIDQEVHQSLMGREVRAALVGTFAAVAVVLALAGLTGTLARSVVERRREIAIRTALGSTPRGTVRLVLRDGLLLVGIGVGVGLGLAAALGRSVATLLHGVSPYDWLTFAGVTVGVVSLAAAASWLPAYRAARVSPLELLRFD
jgi:predicted permease